MTRLQRLALTAFIVVAEIAMAPLDAPRAMKRQRRLMRRRLRRWGMR